MLLNLLMMFAELEQKTIAGRVRDNYYARAAQQLALGGTPPYGYTGKNVRISNHTATILEVQPDEAAQVQAFYTGYGVSCAARCMSGATSGALSFCRNRAWN